MMDRWVGKVAIVTGASAGIGAQIAVNLVQAGMIVVGVARRVEKIRELAATIGNTEGRLYPMACDVSKEEDILRVFQYVDKEFGGLSVLVNNAAVAHDDVIIEGSTEHFHEIMNVNVIGTAICTREAVRSMRERNNPGHIININSYAGHYAECVRIPNNLYVASKYAVTGLSHSVRHEISAAKLNIKVTSISPGAVDTDMIRGFIPNELTSQMVMLTAKDVADAVQYALSTPATVEVTELIISTLESFSAENLVTIQEKLMENA